MRLALVFALVAGALAGAPTPASAIPPGMLPGIDVSHWQGTIDWTKVAAEGVRFAILKATEGRSWVDPTYAANVSGATANGIAVGAYHFATPSAQSGDAVEEADHFVQIARNSAGDVVPALDIEGTGGLTIAGLQSWVQEWLAEVQRKIGVRPMIYSSPGFWRYAMGDTQWFADNGYAILWVAHWGVHRPTVPANDWGGRGWTYWQWTDCWHVNGISGCVDGDRFNGINLVGGEIAQLTVTSTGGGSVTGLRISCGGGATRCSRLSTPGDALTLTMTPTTGAESLGWAGTCASAGTSPACTVVTSGKRRASATFGYPIDVTKSGTGDGVVSATPAGISCGATCETVYAYGTEVTLEASADSASGFAAWGGACGGLTPSCTVADTSPISVTARFDAAIQLPDDGTGTHFAWGHLADARALGGSYLVDHRAGASVTFAFTGPRVTWYTLRAPLMGGARVSIDGLEKGTFSGYAPRFHASVAHPFTGLGAGQHSITIQALGTSAASASGTRVAVDAIEAGGVLHRTPVPSSANWSRVTAASADGGSYLVSDIANAEASLRFMGTGVSWTTVLGPSMGRAQMWIDGKLVRTVDLSATTTAYGATRTVSGLTDVHHVLRIVVLGERGAHGTGTAVAVDAWTVS